MAKYAAALLLAVFALPGEALAQSPVPLGEILDSWHDYYVLENPLLWRMKVGDDPQYSQPDFDDSAWKTVNPRPWLDPGEPGPIVWFRLRVDVEPEWVNQPLFLWLSHAGATEIYVDGERTLEIGDFQTALDGGPNSIEFFTPPPRPFSFSHAGETMIAARVAVGEGSLIRPISPTGTGLILSLTTPYRAESRTRDTFKIHRDANFFTGAAFALALAHLLMFAFHRKKRRNLYYSATAFFMGCIPLFVYLPHQTTNLTLMSWIAIAFKISVLGAVILALFLLHSVRERPIPLHFKIYATIGVALGVMSWIVPINVIYIFLLLAVFEAIRTAIVVKLENRPRAAIVALGVGGWSLFGGIQMMQAVVTIPILHNAYLWGAFIFLLSMSIYLARDFAETNVQLDDQVKRTLEQELKAAGETIARQEAEAESARKEIELEEARKREKVLKALEVANKQLIDTQAQLVQSEKMASLGQLVAGIAHEINTPIGAVYSTHDNLKRALARLRESIDRSAPELSEKEPKLDRSFHILDDAARIIEEGSGRVSEIVKRLKSFARLDEAELQTSDVREGIEDTLMLVRHETKTGIEVITEFGDVPPFACYAGQLNQVFLNIIMNAVQAMDGKGQLRIRTWLEAGKANISFSDTGRGIAAENLDQIFDPGFTTKGVKVGTGLGLSISYRIVQAHDGEIRVDSTPGEGTTFTVVLPTDLDRTVS